MATRDDAIAIWKAGVAAVDSARLVREHVSVRDGTLLVCDQPTDLARLRRIEVLGAGKAGAGMAAGLEAALDPLPTRISRSGWLNVPADCVRPLDWITLHAARPAGVNEPTAAGVEGTSEILRRAASLGPDDLCLVLLSGGGSALLCAPAAGVTLDDKVEVTRRVAAAGAPIHELNLVRTRLSRVKGGGLRQACTAGTLITLIISDVVGDPPDIIASGPTVAPTWSDHPADVLHRRGVRVDDLSPAVRHLLAEPRSTPSEPPFPARRIERIIGRNQTACHAAVAEAERRGYATRFLGSEHQRDAADEGRELFATLQQLRDERRDAPSHRRLCVIHGGEPTVRLAETTEPRRGGRNQELVLAAVADHSRPDDWRGLVLLSGGTDGEDGPTDAAGAVADAELVRRLQSAGIDPRDYLRINNSYPFFERLDGLLKTGPTHTNVMDVRVGLVER